MTPEINLCLHIIVYGLIVTFVNNVHSLWKTIKKCVIDPGYAHVTL